MFKQTLALTMKFPTRPMQTIQILKKTENLHLSTDPVRHVVKQTTPQRNVTLEQMQRTKRLPGIDDRKEKTKSNREMFKATRRGMPSCSPNFKLESPRLHSGAACDRPETTEIPKLPPIPEVVWQLPMETISNEVNLKNTNNDSLIYYTREKATVTRQTSPPKGTQPHNYVVTTEHPPGNQTRTNQYRSVIAPRTVLLISKI